MFGLLLVALSSVFAEAATSIGKREIQLRRESVYSCGFLDLLWIAAFFFGQAIIIPGSFVFDPASLPTFSLRVAIELVLVYFAVHAIAAADRSTFGFLRIITIPLLLGIDLALGYAFSSYQLIGIGVILVAFVVLFMNHGIRARGVGYVLGSAVLAAFTISLYKYNITHYNSVVAEEGIISLIVMAFLFFMARVVARQNPFRLLRNPVIFMQSLASGVGGVFASFAYLFGSASVIATASRTFNVIASVIAGNLYFKEKHLAVKLVAFVLMAGGLTLLAF